ncbi:hypothetical protein ILUMI_11080 [Ignelater luminosus]|uniref:Zinc finger protein n=1 Tax=Ignelater luminosus TaxID=2038154 RepID=A0A8K0GAU8_IGNLU|nr:hypothetical protein ILUMI_11080 [Ignelater luminosus]
MEFNVDNKCRACLAEGDEMMSLFEVYEHDLTLASILQSCISTEINEDDGLPSRLCDNCILVLIQFYNFTVVYEQSEKELKSLLNKSNKKLETNSVGDVQTDVHSNEFIKDELLLTDTSHRLGNVATIVNLDVSREREPANTYQENLDYFELKSSDYYIEEKQEINIADYVKRETNVLDELKKENILSDGIDNSNSETEYLQVHVADADDVEVKKEEETVEQENIYEEYETITKYECSICGEAHLFVSSFQQHMRVKHLMPDIDCKEYARRVRIKVNPRMQQNYQFTCLSQQQEEFSENETKYTCKVCDKEFSTSSSLQQHSKLHDVNKKYVCEICGQRFIRKNYLSDHMEGHSTEKNHICKFCGKAFRRRTVLRAHKRVHTHPNHYVCEQCGRAFTNSSTLKTHRMLIHIKERNFKCVICNLTFPLKSTLNKHVLRHQKRENGEKGFNCIYCEMQYRDKSSLKRHIEIKHQGRVQLVCCPDCPKKYTSKANLVKHRQRHHSVAEAVD